MHKERLKGQERTDTLDEKQDYIRTRSEDSEEYRIVFDRDRVLSDIILSCLFLVFLIDSCLLWFVFFIPGKVLLIIFFVSYSSFQLLLKPKATYIALDMAGGIISTEEFRIKVEQVIDIHLKILKNLDMVDNSLYRYSVNLVYRDKNSDLSKHCCMNQRYYTKKA